MTPYIALAAATLEQELSRRHDYLTGLLNGNFFYDIMHRRIIGLEPFGLAYCDMDGLKQINDSLGHEAGDHAIQQFANTLQTIIKSLPPERKFMAFRLHGDEFALVFNVNALGRNAPLPQPCLRAIADSGASMGIATKEPDDTVSSLIRRAELQMYRDKDSKRLAR